MQAPPPPPPPPPPDGIVGLIKFPFNAFWCFSTLRMRTDQAAFEESIAVAKKRKTKKLSHDVGIIHSGTTSVAATLN